MVAEEEMTNALKFVDSCVKSDVQFKTGPSNIALAAIASLGRDELVKSILAEVQVDLTNDIAEIQAEIEALRTN